MAADRDVQIRLLGGLAFRLRCSDWSDPLPRTHRDIDLATRSTDRKAAADLLTAAGYVPDRHYNALYGHRQMYFFDPDHQRPLDLIVDRLEMCHTVAFSERLSEAWPTLPLAELLLSKLQIVRINRKDVLDTLALLSEYPLTDDDAGINRGIITSLTSSDWGWWRTVTGNLIQLSAFTTSDLRPGDLEFGRAPRFDVARQISDLGDVIESAPKSLRWRVRARLGERVPWFQEPEEVTH